MNTPPPLPTSAPLCKVEFVVELVVVEVAADEVEVPLALLVVVAELDVPVVVLLPEVVVLVVKLDATGTPAF